MDSANLLKLKNTLLEIAPEKKFALAFSAGVDSTILLNVAVLMGFDVLAVTFNTNLTSRMISISNAKNVAEELGVKHITLDIDVMSDENINCNSKLRCYYCKSKMFSALKKLANENGYSILCDGTNADDLLEYRPGLKAKDECGVLSPIAMASLTKTELREIGNELGLEIAKKPSSPCLLTRFPYGTTVTNEMLETVESGEQLIKDAGFEACRLRVHGNVARIELPIDRLADFVNNSEKQTKLISDIKALGFDYVTVDLEGLRSGSMDI